MDTLKESNGQKRVKAIAEEILHYYPVDLDKVESTAYDELMKRLFEDTIIRQDKYTGCLILGTVGVAKAYLSWLERNRHPAAGNSRIKVDFNRIIFRGSVTGHWQDDIHRRVFEGGAHRPEVTARAVISLVKGRAIPTAGIALEYYTHSRITVVLGGNHRLLAYKLLGKADFPIEATTIYEEAPPHEALNEALVLLESLLPHPNQKIELTHSPEAIIHIADKFKSSTELYQFTKEDLQSEYKIKSLCGASILSSSIASPSLQQLQKYIHHYEVNNSFFKKWNKLIRRIDKNEGTEDEHIPIRLRAWLKNRLSYSKK